MTMKINYIELPARDLGAVKQFYAAAFGWEFTDFGPEYASFSAQTAGLDGGFFASSQASVASQGAALVVLFAADLEASVASVEQAGGRISQAPFEFPGGRRFHFIDPAGNEMAVWTNLRLDGSEIGL